jgi:hypothetical protein
MTTPMPTYDLFEKCPTGIPSVISRESILALLTENTRLVAALERAEADNARVLAQASDLHAQLAAGRKLVERLIVERDTAEADNVALRSATSVRFAEEREKGYRRFEAELAALRADLARVTALLDIQKLATAGAQNLCAGEQERAETAERGCQSLRLELEQARAGEEKARSYLQAANNSTERRGVERDAALGRVAALREALSELAEAVANDADERRSISGRVGARLTDARSALADPDAAVVARDERLRLEERAKAYADRFWDSASQSWVPLAEHDERLMAEAAGRERAVVYRELREGALDGQLADHDERVRADERAKVVRHDWQRTHDAEVRAAALAKCAEAVDRLAQMSHHPNTVAGVAVAVRGWARDAAKPEGGRP